VEILVDSGWTVCYSPVMMNHLQAVISLLMCFVGCILLRQKPTLTGALSLERGLQTMAAVWTTLLPTWDLFLALYRVI